MVTIAVIISFIALVGAGFAFLRASSSHRILNRRIEDLKEKNSYLEGRIRKLEGPAARGNKAAGATNEAVPRNQPRQEQHQETRQKQRDRQQPHPIPQQPRQEPQTRQDQPQQQKRHKENRRRNEPMETNKYNELGQEQPRGASAVNLEIAGGDLLAELEQAAGNTAPQTVVDSGKRYAIIPEDGVIRLHQLQQRPDSDSYLEVDVPAEGNNITGYRFNLSGNHAFVISQGIDRLENAFSFEKPSNRMVSQVVLQGDGVLTKINNGWKIQEKAKIDFR